MSCADRDALLTACTCCDGLERLTPVELFNRPGLPALAYRVGTHGRFKGSMLAGISTRPALVELTARRDDDLTIALVDGWAAVLDVLSFYQERIANEGFLRTAVERLSLRELARAIGYELAPGVAASTWLAFTLDDSPGSPPRVTIPAGTRAQSTPGQDELPQAFETGEEIVGRARWNALRPRRSRPQLFSRDSRRFYLQGTTTGVTKGDWLLLRAGEKADPADPGEIGSVVLRVRRVETDDARDHTVVDTVSDGDGETGEDPGELLREELATLTGFTFAQAPVEVFTAVGRFTADTARQLAGSYSFSSAEVQILEINYGLAPGSFGDLVNAQTLGPEPPAEAGLFALRQRSAVFGHNAQRWKTLPAAWRPRTGIAPGNLPIGFSKPFPVDWEAHPPAITEDSRHREYKEIYGEAEDVILLERKIDEIVPDSWLVLKGSGSVKKEATFRVAGADEVSRADFGLSGKVTRLTLSAGKGDEIGAFKLRDTEVLAASEALALAEEPIDDDVPAADDAGRNEVELDRMLVHQLDVGRVLALTGERADVEEEGVRSNEMVVVSRVESAAGVTRLTFESPLEHRYRRDTVTLNANVAPATHGETRRETLGSGDAGTPFQSFALRHAPLTHVASEVAPSGAESTLELRVNGLRWHRAPDFFRLGPEDRGYVLRSSDDGGTRVLFGDGERGARPPSGVENVTAVYRTGIGLAGEVAAQRVNLLATRPLGVREVTNPVAATGAEDPETRDQARRNAPQTVRTLDRIVSLSDFEDFARTYAGIGKARADRVWDGERRLVYVTLAGAGGDPADGDLIARLRGAMDAARDPFQPLALGPFRRRQFELRARLELDPDVSEAAVLAEVEARLRASFRFEARDFGQSVARSDVITLMQETPGVEAVDLDAFDFSPTASMEPTLAERLDALPAALAGGAGTAEILGAELLTLAPGPVDLEVIR